MSDPDSKSLPRPFFGESERMPATESTPDIRKEIGPYKIVTLLGAGTAGSVFLAVHTALGRNVALELIRTRPEDIQRTERLINYLAGIRHPQLCSIYEAGRVGDDLYTAMEYVQGQSLAQMIGGKTLPLRLGIMLVIKIACAMQYLHSHGVIHRNLKPTNIVIDERGEPRIVGFGLAIIVRDDERSDEPSGGIAGTPAYMSPEQFEGIAGAQSDIYSLGVILYLLMTGRLPFTEKTSRIALSDVRTRTPPPPSSVNPDIDSRLEAICLRALEKDPSSRFASMSEFASALEGYLGSISFRMREAVGNFFKRSGWRQLTQIASFMVRAALASRPTFGHAPDAAETGEKPHQLDEGLIAPVLTDWEWAFTQLQDNGFSGYKERHVAIHEKKVVGSGQSAAELRDGAAQGLGIPPERLVVLYLEDNEF